MKASIRLSPARITSTFRRAKKNRTRSIRNSVSRWMDRSKDFLGTLPTAKELREEFADWHSFEPIDPRELGLSAAVA